MGYDVHITRCEHWSDEHGPKIDLSEWLDYVETDPEMRLDGYAEADLGDGQVLRTEDKSLAVWRSYSGHQEDGNKAWMYLFDGTVDVKNPDEEIRAKMCRIAVELGARVQGDDGELYTEDNLEGALPEAAVDDAITERRPWWKFW